MRRRRLTALGAVALLAVVGGIAAGAGGGADDGGSSGATNAKTTATTAAAPEPAQLPGGGRRLFPDRRVVAFYGNPRDDELGALGIGTPAQAAKRLLKQAKPYNLKTRPVLPAMELVSTVATAAPGDAGLYRDHMLLRQDPPLPRRRAQDRRAVDPRHPARPRRVRPGDHAAGARSCASPTSASRSIPSGTSRPMRCQAR